jgi:hypothetical protein
MIVALSIALVAAALAGWNHFLAESEPVIVEEPTTLELALVGIATLAIYSVTSRYWRRVREEKLRREATFSSQSSGESAPADVEQPSREAA